MYILQTHSMGKKTSTSEVVTYQSSSSSSSRRPFISNHDTNDTEEESQRQQEKKLERKRERKRKRNEEKVKRKKHKPNSDNGTNLASDETMMMVVDDTEMKSMIHKDAATKSHYLQQSGGESSSQKDSRNENTKHRPSSSSLKSSSSNNNDAMVERRTKDNSTMEKSDYVHGGGGGDDDNQSSGHIKKRNDKHQKMDSKRKKAKKKKKHKEKRKNKVDDDDDDDDNQSSGHIKKRNDKHQKMDSKRKKAKKKKKHKEKRKNKVDDDDDDDEVKDHDEDDETDAVNTPKLAADVNDSSPTTSITNHHQTQSNKTQLLDAQHRAESQALTGNASKDRGRIVASSAIEFYDEEIKQQQKRTQQRQEHQQQPQIELEQEQGSQNKTNNKNNNSKNKELRAQEKHNITLLLFYQYVEPVWDEATYHFMLKTLQELGTKLGLTGRMRVAKEGLNCTLTANHAAIVEYCTTLRTLRPTEFASTEFKLTNDLPMAQKFPNLKVFKVVELVHYGLEGSKAPPIAKFQGTHLEPKEYHEKLAQSNTVIIDVRNHYEAAIGRFVPPNAKTPSSSYKSKSTKDDEEGPQWLDPKMRKSTEFPVWLDKPETKEMMKGKQVLMYCTGGIRCERASALLKYKMETDPEIKELGIQGVYQLQGGIDKYFKEFPDGGYWQGKNYVFDKRFAHAPPKVDGELHGKADKGDATGDSQASNPDSNSSSSQSQAQPHPHPPQGMMGKCEACQKPWDMYRGKRRCPTCGVPSLICRDCFLADKEGRTRLGKQVRCDLCVEQGITSKRELKQRDQAQIEEYERKMAQRGLLQPGKGDNKAPNPDQVTRLQLKNMCRKNMDEATLMDTLPGITHIVWRIERKSGKFLGQGWIQMATPDDAARAVAQDGKIRPFGRPLYISFQAPDGKDAWPPPSSAVDLSLYGTR